MAALAAGVLQKLVDGMNNGTEKPVGEHRTALLQVTDIVPADLDEKDLWPKHGFYIKVSDSSHSIYATLPVDQHDLVLTNKLHLGQFIHVQRLHQASPVPIIVGAKPLPGRHPLLGTPEPIDRSKSTRQKSVGHRRGSWGSDPDSAVRPTVLEFDDKTPLKGRAIGLGSSPISRTARSSVSGGLFPRIAEGKETSSASVRKSCSVSSFARSKSVVVDRNPRIPRSPFHTENAFNATATPKNKVRNLVADEEDSNCAAEENGSSISFNQSFAHSASSASPKNSSANRLFSLPGKLSILGKEAIQQRELAQKAALQALRDATATETIVRVLKMFSELSNSAKPETPASCFDQFLSFHQEVVQAAKDMESIQAATSIGPTTSAESDEQVDKSILQENNQCGNSIKKRTLLVSKSVSFAATETNDAKMNLGKHPRSTTTTNAKNKTVSSTNSPDETHCSLENSLKLAKKVRIESGKWFMNFLEEALDSGLKKNSNCKGSCPQSVILRVINWVELEQSERAIHPKASQIARKLRIKAKNP